MASTRKGDDDDNVSVTSTAASEEREEYLVDRIVGERENEGTTEYLVMWEGYPDYRCTWEPENNFNDGVILPTWNHTKLRVKRGLEQPFNVTALEQKIRDWEEATALRKHLRREKRKRIGLPVAESEEDEEEAQDEDSHEQQAQILTEETLHSPHPRQEAEKQSESDTVEYSSDEDDNVLPMHRTDSIASQSISSDEDRPVLRKKGIARKLSYQGTQQPSKTARENPKGAHETHEKLLTAALRASHDDISQQEQRKRQENTTQMKNASKPALGHAKPRGDLTSRRTSIETSLKKSSKPQPTNPHFVRSEPLNPVEISDTPKKRGRPVGWRKHPTPSDSTSKEPQQPRVGVKTAPSFTKRKVTGSVISKNWNKPIPKKRLSFATSSHVTDNPGITNAKNQNRFRNLATQHKFAKASRNEPPPRMQDLVLYNAKDGPPKPGVKHLTPFQMIQAKMAAEASGSAGQTIEKERKVSFGDIEESPDDANPTSPEIPQPSAPPLTIETRKSVSFLEQEGKSDSPNVHSTGLRKTVMFADVEDMVASPVNVSVGNGVKKTPTESDHVLNSPVELSHETSSITNPQSAAIIEEPQEKYGDEVDGDPMDLSPDYSPPENMAVDTTRHTLSDAQRLINSWGFQNPPSTRPDPLERSVTNGSRRSRPNVKYESGKEPPGDLATVKASPLSEEVGEKDSCEPSIYSLQDARHGKSDVTSTSSGWYDPSNTEEVPPVLSWSQTQGNVGQHTFGCHVYGTIFRGEYFAMKCAFKGLPYLSKTLFLSIKVPPKDVNVKIRHTLTPENYKRYFHTVSIIIGTKSSLVRLQTLESTDFNQDKPLYFGAGHVHVLEYRQEAADELAEELKSHGLGGLYFAKEFSLLFYPTGTDEWSFLDAHFVKEAQLPVSLRFVMFLPIPEFFGLRAIETPVGDSPIGLLEGEPAINRLFREAYQIDYKKLVIDDNKSEYIHEDTFFIMYPPFKKDEHDLLVSFLEANRATVYSSYTPGAWDYVLKEANHAIILASKVQIVQLQVLTRWP